MQTIDRDIDRRSSITDWALVIALLLLIVVTAVSVAL